MPPTVEEPIISVTAARGSFSHPLFISQPSKVVYDNVYLKHVMGRLSANQMSAKCVVTRQSGSVTDTSMLELAQVTELT